MVSEAVDAPMRMQRYRPVRKRRGSWGSRGRAVKKRRGSKSRAVKR